MQRICLPPGRSAAAWAWSRTIARSVPTATSAATPPAAVAAATTAAAATAAEAPAAPVVAPPRPFIVSGASVISRAFGPLRFPRAAVWSAFRGYRLGVPLFAVAL